uniref:MT domain-containing protein n=1 Tax=Taenia asiatica TaxID=60517 RepID=A0A0R3VXE3_TAEAS
LSVVCVPTDKTDPKLLPSVGIYKLANLTKLADDEEFKKQIGDTIDEMAKGISKQIPQDLIQKLDNMKTKVATLKKALQLYDAAGAVTELKKFTEVDMKKLEDLQKDVEAKLPNKPVVDKLKAAIGQLKNNQTDIMVLQNAYQGIANQSTLPDDLEKYIDEAKKALELLKDEVKLKGVLEKDIKPMLSELITKILQVVTDALNGLVSKVLPCGDMHYIFEALVATGCSSSGLVTRFFGWALALTLSTLFSFLSFVGLFNLWCIQSHQIKRFYGP